MTQLTVDPAVGLPSGHPVLGSVNDGVTLPYALDLGSATTARLVLTFDDRTVADIASAPARGTVTLPSRSPGLQKADDVAVRLTALDQSGATLATAQTVGTVTDGVDLGVLLAYAPSEVSVADGAHLTVNQGTTVRFHATAHTRMVHANVSAYGLTIDGVSILDDATVGGHPDQWVSGTWNAPAAAGDHTVVYWASIDGDSSRTQQTVTLSVQPAGSFSIDNMTMNYAVSANLGEPFPCAGTLKVASTYSPVAGAQVQVLWQNATGGDWTPVAAATTDAQGHFTTAWQPSVSGSYQIVTQGVPGTVGATSSSIVRLDLQTHLRLSVDRTAATVGSALTFTLAAPAAMSGVDSLLQLWNGQCWNTVALAPLDARGGASLSYVVSMAGNYKFGAMTGYSSAYAPTASDDLTVVVR